VSASKDVCISESPRPKRDAWSKWIVLAAFAFASGYLGTRFIASEKGSLDDRSTPIAAIGGMVFVPGGQF